MRQDVFRKPSRCLRFSEIFRCVINNSMRHKHKLSYFSLKAILNTILRMENIGQIYHKSKKSVKYLIMT